MDAKQIAIELLNSNMLKLKEIGREISLAGVNPAIIGLSFTNISDEEDIDCCDIILLDSGPNKLNVLKELKDITGIGLKEAKELIDDAPSTIINNISNEQAYLIQERFRNHGAITQIVKLYKSN